MKIRAVQVHWIDSMSTSGWGSLIPAIEYDFETGEPKSSVHDHAIKFVKRLDITLFTQGGSQ